MTEPTSQTPVAATLVPEPQRLEILPKFFGARHMIRAEGLVYAWMKRLDDSYAGDYWHYYTLSNGGFFMAPSVPAKRTLNWHGHFEVSAEAAGIAASMFAINQLCNETELDEHIELYYALRTYAIEHAEHRSIMSLVD
jgi:hypothetical protein